MASKGSQTFRLVGGVAFLSALDGVANPGGQTEDYRTPFIEVFEDAAAKIGGADFLAQGTLYPDVIESVSFTGGRSVTIKSHHNMGGLPERMRMKLVGCANQRAAML